MNSHAMLQDPVRRLEAFAESYDSSHYDALPKFIKRRLDALKKIQLEHIEYQHQYHKELQALEMKYDKLYQPLYERRQKIVSGEHEPSDEECQLPASIVQNDFDGDQENEDVSVGKVITPEEEPKVKDSVKGVPGFWLGCLSSAYNFTDSIEDHDKPVLKFLKDIKLAYGQEEDLLTYKLEFLFDENPYLTNTVLTKTYYLKLKPDEKDPFSYDGFEVLRSQGCEINWNPGKDVTKKTVTVKQLNKNDGRTREKKKEVEQDSFFYFFKPPQLPEKEEDLEEEMGAVMHVDFELGEVIRQSVIPRAVLYYTGLMIEDDDDHDDESSSDEDISIGDSDDYSDSDDDDDDDDDSLSEDKEASKSKKTSSAKRSPKGVTKDS